MNTVKGNEVIQALMADEEFAAQPVAVFEAMKPYFEALPRVIADLLQKPANLTTLTDAKLAFLRYASQNGYITAVVNAIPEEALGWFSREEFSRTMENLVANLIKTLADMLADIPAFLDNAGSEEQVMLSPKVGLSPDLLLRYKAGELTINDIARYQPTIIVKNTY